MDENNEAGLQRLVPQLAPPNYALKPPYAQREQRSKQGLMFQEFLNIY